MKLLVIDGDGGAPFLLETLTHQEHSQATSGKISNSISTCLQAFEKSLQNPIFYGRPPPPHHSSKPFSSLLVLQSRPMHLRLLNCEMHVHEIEEARLIDSMDGGRLFARIVGSTNGLLCIEINKYDDDPYSHPFLVWNPAIREVRWVPRTITQVQCHFFIGFGFSPFDDDHKIVMIYSPKSNVKMNRVKVYSSSSRSRKEVECGILEGIILRLEPITANGEMFWFGSRQGVEDGDNDDGYDVLISFDTVMKVFMIMPTPDLGSVSSRSLFVYESKLVVISFHAGQDFKSSLIDLWVKERWGWVKKYTRGSFSRLEKSCDYLEK